MECEMLTLIRRESIQFEVPDYGRSDLEVRQFTDDGEGNLYMRAPKGLFRRDKSTGTWHHVEDIKVKYKQYVEHIHGNNGLLFVLNSKGTLYRSADRADSFKAKATKVKNVNRVIYNPAFDVALVGGDSSTRQDGAFVLNATSKKPDLLHVGRFESMWPCCLHDGAIVSALAKVLTITDPDDGWTTVAESLPKIGSSSGSFDMLLSTGEVLLGITSRSYNTPTTIISKSSDGGTSWERVFSCDEEVVSSTSDADGHVIAATKTHLVFSDDHGATWHTSQHETDYIFDQVHLCDGKLWASMNQTEGYKNQIVDDDGNVLIHVFELPIAPEATQTTPLEHTWARHPLAAPITVDRSNLPAKLPGMAEDEPTDLTAALYLDPDTLLTSDITGRLHRWTRDENKWSLDQTLLQANPHPITAMILDPSGVLAARNKQLFVFDPATGETVESYPVQGRYFWLHRHQDVIVAGYSWGNSYNNETRLDGLHRFKVDGATLIALEPLPDLPKTTNFRVSIDHVDALDNKVLYVNQIPNKDGAIWNLFDLETEEVSQGSSKSLREVGLMPSDHNKLWAIPSKAMLKTGINASTARGGKKHGDKRKHRGYIMHVPGAYVIDRAPDNYADFCVQAIEPYSCVATAVGLRDLFERGTHVRALAPDASSLVADCYSSTPYTVCLETDARAPLGTRHIDCTLRHDRQTVLEGTWSGLAHNDTHAYFLHDSMLTELDLATGALTTLGGPITTEVDPKGWLVDGYWLARTHADHVLVFSLETGELVRTLEIDGQKIAATTTTLYLMKPPEDQLDQKYPKNALWRVDLTTGAQHRVAPDILGASRIDASARGVFVVWFPGNQGMHQGFYDEETGSLSHITDDIDLGFPYCSTRHGDHTLIHYDPSGSQRSERWFLFETSTTSVTLVGAGFAGELGHATMREHSANAFALAHDGSHVLTACADYQTDKGIRVTTRHGFRVGFIETPTTRHGMLISSNAARQVFVCDPVTGIDLVSY